MTLGLVSPAGFGLNVLTSPLAEKPRLLAADAKSGIAATEEKTKVMASLAETLDRMTDPAARLAQAQASLQQEMTRVEAELEALQFLKVIDPEAAARAAEKVLARLDRAVSAYSATAKSLSGNAISAESRSSEDTANALKAAVQRAVSQQTAPPPDLPEDLPSPEEVKAGLKQDLLGQIDQIKADRDRALEALQAEGKAQLAGQAQSKSHDDFLEQLRQLTERIASVAEGGSEEEEGEDPARIKGRIRDSIQQAGLAFGSLLRAGRVSPPVDLDIRV